ncbi:MAG: hypothetical protein HOQ01_09745 [Lysobacter sp.]|nr:hypothetical protein [Lysobacter sp.]
MKLLPLSLAVAVLALSACNKPADTTATPAPSPVAPAATVAPAPVATVAQASANAGSIDTFDLTMDNVDAMLRAQVALGAATKADPSLDPAMNISEENDAQYVARLEASPALKQAIEGAGISVHDYAYTSQSLVATMMAVGAVDAGQLKAIPDGVNPRNVEFVRAHGAEIEKKMRALGGEG